MRGGSGETLRGLLQGVRFRKFRCVFLDVCSILPHKIQHGEAYFFLIHMQHTLEGVFFLKKRCMETGDLLMAVKKIQEFGLDSHSHHIKMLALHNSKNRSYVSFRLINISMGRYVQFTY